MKGEEENLRERRGGREDEKKGKEEEGREGAEEKGSVHI